MKKLLYVLGASCFIGTLYAGTISRTSSSKSTGDTLTATEYNGDIDTVYNEINGNLDDANLKANAVTTSEIQADAVTPAKVDDDNETDFTMLGVTVTTGTFTKITASTGAVTLASATVDNLTTNDGDVTVSTITLKSDTTRYLSIPPPEVQSIDNTGTYSVNHLRIRNDAGGFTALDFYAPVQLPQDAKISGITWHFYRDDASATGVCILRRTTIADQSTSDLATLNAFGTGGWVSTNTKVSAPSTVDNTLYSYVLNININNNNSVEDCLSGVVLLSYTVTGVLP